jgi:hypothetical protein
MASIGIEVIRLALEDAAQRQQEIDQLLVDADVNTHILELVHKQTALLTDTIRLFNRMV